MGQKATKEYVDISLKCTAPSVIFHEEIQTINGAKRNVVSWLPEDGNIKAIVLISHGYIEHSLAYYRLAHKLVENNYGVYAMDHVAHGKSDGVRGVIPNYQILYSDYIEFANKIGKQYETLPLFLFAHSMGTLVATLSINGIHNLKAVILSAPAIFSGPASSSPFGIRCLFPLTQTSAAVCLTSITATLDPQGSAAPLLPSAVCSNEEVIQEMQEDNRRNPAYVTNKSAQQLLRMIRAAKEEITHVEIPFFVFHGDQDLIALKSSSEYIFKHAKTNIMYRKLHIFPNAKHEIIREKDPLASECMQMIVSYFDEQYIAATTTASGTTNDVIGTSIEEIVSDMSDVAVGKNNDTAAAAGSVEMQITATNTVMTVVPTKQDEVEEEGKL